jgi:hypothetical protein
LATRGEEAAVVGGGLRFFIFFKVLQGENMYKERSSSLAAEVRGGNVRGGEPLHRDVTDNKKRLEDGIEKSSPSTSKGGIGREKSRIAAAATTAQTRRSAGHEARPPLEKAKYPDDGELP